MSPVSSDAKAGKDAAGLAGLADSTGVGPSTDLNAVLATGPQCAMQRDGRQSAAGAGDYRRVGGRDQYRRQRPGVAVANEIIKPLQTLRAQEIQVCALIGIDPGTTCCRGSWPAL